ncbi:MAG: arginine--tRNA ligase [Micropepsaceae bacterium]
MRPSLIADLTAAMGRAFAAEGLDPALGRVTVSDRPDLAQFQSNGALAAAKAAKANPRALAEKLAAHLKSDPRFAKVEIAGPGFLNIDLTDAALAASLATPDALLAPDASGSRGKVLIDFGGPNVAKAMHVGHLRSSILGDALQRHFRFAGFDVTSDVHLGDWGKPMGLLITEIAARQPDLPYFDAAFTGPYPAESPVSMDELEVLYPAAAAAAKADPARDEAARIATAELQQGRAGYRALWKHFVDVSIAGIKREFASLGVVFDIWKGEADVDPLIAPMLDDLKSRNIAEMDDGALIVRVAEPADKKETPPLILVKRDGGVLYETTDVATIIDRVRNFAPGLILYVVDQRQHEHFEKVFRASRKAGYAGAAELEHVGFGTINGADGKPFKTRAGGVLKLYDLIEMGKAEAAKRLTEQGIGADYPEAERDEIARQVGLAAIKFCGSLELPPHQLYFRPRTLHEVRRQDRAVSAIRRRPREIPAAPCGGGGRGARRHRHPGGRGARPRAGAAAFPRCAGRNAPHPRPERHVRLCLPAGAGVLQLLCRAPHPQRDGGGPARLAAGPERADAPGAGNQPRPARHRSAGKNVAIRRFALSRCGWFRRRLQVLHCPVERPAPLR